MYSKEEFDQNKTKVLKYILYQKRSEHEIRNKFAKTIEENQLDDIIEYLREAGYINDRDYIRRTVNQWMAIKNMSLWEVQYKLMTKGIKKHDIEDYMDSHYEELAEYEKRSAKTIAIKKSYSQEVQNIENFLRKKGYKQEAIEEALEEI